MKREKKACLDREMKQLNEKIGIKTVYYNNVKYPVHLSKKQEEKEAKTRKWMDLKSIDILSNPEHYKTKGLTNSPRSTFNKLQTEFEIQKEKYTCSNISDYEKKNARYQFNHGVNMPVKRKSSSAGIKQVSYANAMKLTELARLQYDSSSDDRRKMNEASSVKTTEVKTEKIEAKRELK